MKSMSDRVVKRSESYCSSAVCGRTRTRTPITVQGMLSGDCGACSVQCGAGVAPLSFDGLAHERNCLRACTASALNRAAYLVQRTVDSVTGKLDIIVPGLDEGTVQLLQHSPVLTDRCASARDATPRIAGWLTVNDVRPLQQQLVPSGRRSFRVPRWSSAGCHARSSSTGSALTGHDPNFAISGEAKVS